MTPRQFNGSNPVSRRRSLRVNAYCDDDGKDNRSFYNVNPQCALRESQNSICCCHDFTQYWTVQTLLLNMGITI
jgi:hypothetical protein